MQINGLAKLDPEKIETIDSNTLKPVLYRRLVLSNLEVLVSDTEIDPKVTEEFYFQLQLSPSGTVKVSLIAKDPKEPDKAFIIEYINLAGLWEPYEAGKFYSTKEDAEKDLEK